MTGPAIVRARRPSGKVGTFFAMRAELADGLLTATGYWKDDPGRRQRSYTWPARTRVIEVIWLKVEGAAA